MLVKAGDFRKNNSMPRRKSQLRHDYKPESQTAPARAHHLRWFLLGVGIPVAALAMYAEFSGGPTGQIEAGIVTAPGLGRELPLPAKPRSLKQSPSPRLKILSCCLAPC